MMKVSFYNTYIEENEIFLYYNSFRNSCLLIKPNLHELFCQYENNIGKLKEVNEKFYFLLEGNGFIVPKDFDERDYYLNINLKRKYSSILYHVMLNPTLDCNLNCWYCYENHKKDSVMSEGVINSILLHIKKKYKDNNYKHLIISFFGGEPLLRINSVVLPLLEEINAFVKKEKISLLIQITTNATKLNENLLKFLKMHKVIFQITLDGNKYEHDKIRRFKGTEKGSYTIIINNIRKIVNKLDNYHIHLRINYSNNNLNEIEDVIDDINFVPVNKIGFNFQKVWQCETKSIDRKKLLELISRFQKRGYAADIISLEHTDGSCCYADNYNQLLVNYDGSVFKCTARDFTDENKEGELLQDGTIIWNTNKLNKRLSVDIPEMCFNCSFLPSCPGICSQKRLEQGDKVQCILNDISKEDYIIYNFNKHFAQKQNTA